MSDVFVMAAVAALDAGLLAAAVVLLGRPRPAQRLLAYLIGGMGFSIIFGLVIVFALHGSNLLRQPDARTSAALELAAGGLLIFVAVAVHAGRRVQWHPRRKHSDPSHPARRSLYDRAIGRDSLWVAWAAGAIYSAPGAYYLAGLALLARTNAPAITIVLVIVAFNVIMFALIELPLVGFLMAPDQTRLVTERVNGWVKSHRRMLIMTVAGAGGTYLLVSGALGLA